MLIICTFRCVPACIIITSAERKGLEKNISYFHFLVTSMQTLDVHDRHKLMGPAVRKAPQTPIVRRYYLFPLTRTISLLLYVTQL